MALRRRWLELQLLCRKGIGLAAIAPPVCRLARDIVGAEAASLFWLDRDGMPLGFYHEDSPADTRELFVNEFDRLFVGPDEINVFALARMTGAVCGNVMRPPTAYFRSNTFNLLVRPSGHHHSLDLRVEDAQGGRAVLLLFRGPHPAFTDAEARMLTMFEPLLRRAGVAGIAQQWQADASTTGYLVIDTQQDRIVAISEAAEAMLRQSNLVGQRLSLNGPLLTAPRFVAELCETTLRVGKAVTDIAVPAGRLHADAIIMRAPTDPFTSVFPPPPQVLVTLRHEMPVGVALIGPILERHLSPLRSEILLYAASGGARESVAQTFSLSKEATKKHLSEIYRALELGAWEQIPAALSARLPTAHA